MINFRMLKLSDGWLWIATGGLVLISFMAIFSSTYGMQIKLAGDPWLFVKKQFFSLLAASIALMVFTYIDYKHLKKIAGYLYGATILILFLVLFSGASAHGAQRWLHLG